MPDYHRRCHDTQTGQATTTNDHLHNALGAREQFLKRHPHLRTYQTEIDRVLDKSGGHQGRLAVLGMLIQSKLFQMQQELYKLNEILQKTNQSD